MKKLRVFVLSGLIVGLWGYSSHCYSAGPKIDLQALLAKRIPILLEIGADCCKYRKPVLDAIAKAYAGRAIVTEVDLAVNREMMRYFRIRMIPTQVFIASDGKEFFRHEGDLGREEIIQVFSKMGLARPSVHSTSRPQVPQPAHGPRR